MNEMMVMKMRTKQNENLLRDVAHGLNWFKDHAEFGEDVSVKHRKWFTALNETIADLNLVVDNEKLNSLRNDIFHPGDR